MLESFHSVKSNVRIDVQSLGQQIRKVFWRYPWLINGLREMVFQYRKTRGLISRKRLIAEYFKSHPVRKVCIGAGYHQRDGWLNTDYYPISNQIVFMDATSPFPIEKNSVDYVLCEHVIEHMPYSSSDLMLQQIQLILKPGGKLRIVTPDLDKFLNMKALLAHETVRRYVEWSNITFGALDEDENRMPSFSINRVFREWGHLFIFDRETLTHKLKKIGFVEIKVCRVNESSDSNLVGIEQHGDLVGADFNEFESLVVEATKFASI